jgi:hypothetical protein
LIQGALLPFDSKFYAMITLIRRYDINGAWTHEEEIKIGDYEPAPNSMWKVYNKFELNDILMSIMKHLMSDVLSHKFDVATHYCILNAQYDLIECSLRAKGA